MQNKTSKHRIYAHRGVSSLAPENTLSAFKLCHQHGIKWLECDIDVIADGTVIITHDSTLDRCTNKSGGYYHLTAKDLAFIDAGSWFSQQYKGEPLPTLNQLINLLNTFKLNANIEIKSCEAGKEMAMKLLFGLKAALHQCLPNIEIIISSFNHLLLYEFKKICPQRKIACLYDANANLEDALTTLELCGAEYVHLANDGLTQHIVQKFIDTGFVVNVYTVNSRLRANQLFNWGVEGIFSDYPQLFDKKYCVY